DLSDPEAQPLKPQEGEQWEAGFKYQLDALPAFITLAYFDIEQSNLNDPGSLGTIQQQRGVATVSGVEFESVAYFGDYNLEENVSKLDTESANGFQLASVPEEQGSVWFSYRPATGFTTGGGMRYVGESYGGGDVIETPSYT